MVDIVLEIEMNINAELTHIGSIILLLCVGGVPALLFFIFFFVIINIEDDEIREKVLVYSSFGIIGLNVVLFFLGTIFLTWCFIYYKNKK